MVVSGLTLGSYALSLYFFDARLQAHDQRDEVAHALEHIEQSLFKTHAALQSYASTGNISYRRQFQTELNMGVDHEAGFDLLRSMELNEREKLHFQKIQADYNEYLALAARIVDTAQKNQLAAANALFTDIEFKNSMTRQLDTVEVLRADLGQNHGAKVRELTQRASWASMTALALLICNLLLFWGVLLVFVKRRLVTPLVQLTTSTEKMALLDEVLAALSPVLTGLAQLDQSAAPSATSAIDPQKLKTACDRLTALLQNDDAAAATFWDYNTALFQAAFAQHSPRIAEHLHNFDMEAALDELQEAGRVSGIGNLRTSPLNA